MQFNHQFFDDTENQLPLYLPEAEGCMDTVRLVEVALFRPGYQLELVMDDDRGQAVAYLVPEA